jgi:peptide/nickel transport system permease protein
MTETTLPSISHAGRFGTWIRENPLFALGAAIVVLIVIFGAFAPLLAPYPGDAATATHPFDTLAPPSAAHLFGTDQVGRDILSRVIYGIRVSPIIAVAVIASSCVIGIPLGLLAGYFGGIVDEIIMRITDIFLAVPALLLALAFAIVLPPSSYSTMIAIGIAWWPWYARLVRGEAKSVTTRRYVENARILGLQRWRVMFRHVLPNSVTPVIVQASLDFGGIILTAASLSFLGLGAQDPTPDWGLMVTQGQGYFATQWWVVTFPGVAILITALAFNLLGDGIHERLDPRRVIGR